MKRKSLVVVVDDDPSLRYSLERYFGKYDVDVKTLSDGFELLLFCLYLTPDLIIADVRMPKLDGVTMLRGLRANPATRDVSVIFMSAYPDSLVMEKARELGASYFLGKPFPLASLDQLISKVAPELRLAERNKGEVRRRVSA